MIVALLALVALGADPVVDALQLELDRNMAGLALPEVEGPYFMSYDLEETHDVRITASLGGVVRDYRRPERRLGVNVRVGSPELDNGNFLYHGRTGGFRSRRLVWQTSMDATRRDAWMLADEAYKDAVEFLAHKRSARRGQIQFQRPPEFSLRKGREVDAEPVPPIDAEPFAERCTELSAVFLEHADIEWSEVQCVARTGRRVTIDSEGTQVARPYASTVVRVMARARADDGATTADHVSWVVRTPDDLPPIDQMRTSARAMAQSLEVWRDSPPATEAYIGPVLFTGDATVSLFRQLLLPALSGTPGPEVASFAGGTESTGTVVSLRQRLLPHGFSVVDDPGADPSLPSSFEYDDEGVAARSVHLIDDGVVRDLLMSRVPNDELSRSNGHARNAPGKLPRARPSNVSITAPHMRSWQRLARQAASLASDYGYPYVLVARRLSDPSLAASGDTNRFRPPPTGPLERLAYPVEVVRLYPSGREERVRGYHFRGVDPSDLLTIAGAGYAMTETFLYGGFAGGYPTAGLPTTLTAPAVLLPEVQLVPEVGGVEDPPLLANPLVLRVPPEPEQR